MNKFIQFAIDDAINNIMSAKFYAQNELTMELTTKSNGIETFTFNNIRDYQDAVETFNSL